MVEGKAVGTTSYGYDAVGNRTSVSYPNGTSQVYSYDSNNRLITLKTYAKTSVLVEQYDYTLNAIGQRTLIKELNGRTTAYEYDNLGRLTKETITDSINGNRTTAYTYDKVGNRLSETVNGVTTTSVYDNNDRITSAGTITYTYDANGNTLVENNGGVAKSYSYDKSASQLIVFILNTNPAPSESIFSTHLSPCGVGSLRAMRVLLSG